MNILAEAISFARLRKEHSFGESLSRAYDAVESVISKQVFKMVEDIHDLSALLLEIEQFNLMLDLDEFEGLI